MHILRFVRAKRLIVCPGLLGLLLLASGCSDPNPVTSVDPEVGKAKGEALRQAREKAYGQGGIPKIEKMPKKK